MKNIIVGTTEDAIEYVQKQKDEAERGLKKLLELYEEGERLKVNTPQSIEVQKQHIEYRKAEINFWSDRINEIRKVMDNNG